MYESKSYDTAVSINKRRYLRKKRLALLLPAHNEELILAETIRSAIKSGQKQRDIFVVSDCSTDKTKVIATELLGKDHVLALRRHRGKAKAIIEAVRKFDIENEYAWLHVADADSVFSPNYFRTYRKSLKGKEYTVALGFVQSLRGNWISTYRAFSYTYGQHLIRRVQSFFGMISVFPGPVTSFRTDVLKNLEFGDSSLTEDFDVTLQFHRKNLGKIKFIADAISYTQDPQTLGDFIRQNQRWHRGFFQGIKKYRVGFHGQRIDISLGLQMFQTMLLLLQVFVLVPLYVSITGYWLVIPLMIAIDIIWLDLWISLAAIAAKRWSMLGTLPYFYFLRWIEIIIHVTAFVEVFILNRFTDKTVGWSTAGRRYKLSREALSDITS